VPFNAVPVYGGDAVRVLNASQLYFRGLQLGYLFVAYIQTFSPSDLYSLVFTPSFTSASLVTAFTNNNQVLTPPPLTTPWDLVSPVYKQQLGRYNLQDFLKYWSDSRAVT
jgi:hypothetical protein